MREYGITFFGKFQPIEASPKIPMEKNGGKKRLVLIKMPKLAIIHKKRLFPTGKSPKFTYFFGKITVNFVNAGLLSSWMEPPWSSTTRLTTARPMPLPSVLWERSAW